MQKTLWFGHFNILEANGRVDLIELLELCQAALSLGNNGDNYFLQEKFKAMTSALRHKAINSTTTDEKKVLILLIRMVYCSAWSVSGHLSEQAKKRQGND